jgi:hypothetical protein
VIETLRSGVGRRARLFVCCVRALVCYYLLLHYTRYNMMHVKVTGTWVYWGGEGLGGVRVRDVASAQHTRVRHPRYIRARTRKRTHARTRTHAHAHSRARTRTKSQVPNQNHKNTSAKPKPQNHTPLTNQNHKIARVPKMSKRPYDLGSSFKLTHHTPLCILSHTSTYRADVWDFCGHSRNNPTHARFA